MLRPHLRLRLVFLHPALWLVQAAQKHDLGTLEVVRVGNLAHRRAAVAAEGGRDREAAFGVVDRDLFDGSRRVVLH